MAKNPPDERLVYLAFKNVFKGPDAKLRTLKKIRNVIQNQVDTGDEEVRALVAEHNIDNICNTAKALLQNEIFESTLRAKIHFPSVFEVSPAQSAERVASEAEAARSDADAIRDAAEGCQAPCVSVRVDELELAQKGKRKQLESQVPTTRPRKHPFPRANLSVPSLYPVYLPLNTQHRLLVKVQAALEDACYAFGQRVMRDVLQKEGWDCPESVELNIWARVFRSHEDKFDAYELDQLAKPFPEFLESIAQLRHTAVHRVRVSANTVGQFMIEAESLANILHDDICARMLSRLRREAQQVVDELGRNKDLLESMLTEKLQEIDARRRELDTLERKAVEEMLREDKEYQTLASASLEHAISAPETIQHSASTSEHETSSEVDVDVGSSERPSFGQGGEISPSFAKPHF